MKCKLEMEHGLKVQGVLQKDSNPSPRVQVPNYEGYAPNHTHNFKGISPRCCVFGFWTPNYNGSYKCKTLKYASFLYFGAETTVTTLDIDAPIGSGGASGCRHPQPSSLTGHSAKLRGGSMLDLRVPSM